MIDKSKQYRTRDGRKVRIYAVDAGGVWPVHGAVKLIANIWESCAWRENGSSLSHEGTHPRDLIEVKPRIQRKVWVNVYPGGIVDVHRYSKKDADDDATPGRIACVELTIDCEEGEGL